ncbi:hypothetical protein WJX72_009694 [[Myrmecia] bisecta]|uniref:Uncharacterized protein n=1 Tax=[Myrmecia] bisecta TaxID=41462 RepID=A0AAW1QSB2_9CHLO
MSFAPLAPPGRWQIPEANHHCPQASAQLWLLSIPDIGSAEADLTQEERILLGLDDSEDEAEKANQAAPPEAAAQEAAAQAQA